MNNRPSASELLHKIKEAKKALDTGQARFANFTKVVGELYKLRIDDSGEVWDLIGDLLNEIKIEDYEGSYPPQRSYEKAVEGKDLWAFAWNSSTFKKRMYLKFALKNETFYYISLHESKFSEENK